MIQFHNGFGQDDYVDHPDVTSNVALYQLSGDILDSSGNAYDLTQGAGSALYSAPPGMRKRMCYFDGTNWMYRNARTAALDLTGDYTIEFLLYLPRLWEMSTGTVSYILSYGANGESEATNWLYSIGLDFASTTVYPRWRFLTEYGSGTNVDVYSTIRTPIVPRLLQHWAFTRSNAGLTQSVYCDGMLTETITLGHAVSTAVPTQKLYIGTDANLQTAFLIDLFLGSLRIHNSDLGAATIKADAQACCPWLAP